MPDDPKYVVVVRFPPGIKLALKKLGEVSGRSYSWLGTQALNRLFREMEQGIVLPNDIHDRRISSAGKSASAPFRLGPVTIAWIGRVAARTGKTTSEILRFSLSRYLGNRVRLVQGIDQYSDPLTEEEPRMPPP